MISSAERHISLAIECPGVEPHPASEWAPRQRIDVTLYTEAETKFIQLFSGRSLVNARAAFATSDPKHHQRSQEQTYFTGGFGSTQAQCVNDAGSG